MCKIKLNYKTLKELTINEEAAAIRCDWVHPWFSPKYLLDLKIELEKRLLIIQMGIDDLTASDMLVVLFFNDLCEYNLNTPFIELNNAKIHSNSQ